MNANATNNNNSSPRISVVMGIYNCEATLERAVESIISQTYQDWELIMCDDASTDNTYQLACELAKRDNRITVLRNEKNIGCNVVLNRCIELARGKYIAVMDSDDISLPKRLEREVKILDKNPQYSIVSSATKHFDENGDFMTIRRKERPQPTDFVCGIPHAHGACMIRTKVLKEIGCYITAKRLKRVEDYYMMACIYALGYRGYNIQEILYKVHDNREAYDRRTWSNRINEVYTYNKTYKLLRLRLIHRIMLIRPLLVGMLPRPIYNFLHRRPWA